MTYARNCHGCKYYIPSIREGVGICNRVDDPDFCYAVSPERTTCLYETPGIQLEQIEIEQRDEEKRVEYEKLKKSLRRASRIVDSWPEWKRNALGKIK